MFGADKLLHMKRVRPAKNNHKKTLIGSKCVQAQKKHCECHNFTQ